MPKELTISFPHMGNYHVPITKLLKIIFPEAKVFPAPVMTRKTIELGSRYSPDYICSPFKYNIGNYIESLEQGANVLLQTGMGCRYGYYGEVQEQILKDLGYDFQFICFSREKSNLSLVYRKIKELGSRISFPEFISAILKAVESIRIIDKIEYEIREKIGFETQPGSFEDLHKKLLRALKEAETLSQLLAVKNKYDRELRLIPVSMPENPLKVGLVGELYTLMEPFSNFYIEKQLAKNNILVSRKMSVSFLLFGKKDFISLKKAKEYLSHTVGANGIDSVVQSKGYARLGYDGILHIKSFGCTPELNATPALIKLSRDYGIPVLHLSFDSHTSETGVQTRLEAFSDMIAMRRENLYGTGSQSWS